MGKQAGGVGYWFRFSQRTGGGALEGALGPHGLTGLLPVATCQKHRDPPSHGLGVLLPQVWAECPAAAACQPSLPPSVFPLILSPSPAVRLGAEEQWGTHSLGGHGLGRPPCPVLSPRVGMRGVEPAGGLQRKHEPAREALEGSGDLLPALVAVQPSAFGSLPLSPRLLRGGGHPCPSWGARA